MIDTTYESDNLSTKDKQLLSAEQDRITTELNAKRNVSKLPYNPRTTRITVPKVLQNPSFTLILVNENCHYKNLIFSALNAAYYLYFITDEFTENRKERFIFARHLWDFLKNHTINKSNRALLFREFESWRVKVKGVKTQSTGLKWLNLFLQDALALDDFTATLTQSDVYYLHGLTETMPAPPDEVDAVNLNNWFTKYTWLRRDDIGIGHELYTRLSSPRMLMSSFRVTVENTLLHIQVCKDALIEFFQHIQLSPDALTGSSLLKKKDVSQKQFQVNTFQTKAVIFSMLADALDKLDEQPETLNAALELLVFSHCNPRFRADTLENLKTNSPLNYSIKEKGKTALRYNSLLNIGLFDFDFLGELAITAKKSQNGPRKMPVCKIEKLLFSWLMAYQTVQASDIPKLRLSDFKFVRRANGHITHIECDYWKSRAESVHQIKTLSSKEPIGQAVLRYLEDVTAFTDLSIRLTEPIKYQNLSSGSLIGKLMLLCDETSIKNKLMAKYQEQSISQVFISAMTTLIRNGVNPKTQKARLEKSDTLTSEAFFGLSQIKTSAVYTKSVTFDPTTLLNLNSHTDKTERVNYLNKNNEDWHNRCGRVTRAVMSDITINLFRASNSDKELFESEFTNAIETIKQRSNDTLMRMKLITEKASGRVDELGFYKTIQPINGMLPDVLYLEDSPETVLKLTHYLTELERKYTILLKSAPEFLFTTALPTAEWIECLFDNKQFSNESFKQGQALYHRYTDILPPHFTAQFI